MKFFHKAKDGGPESNVTGYWLIEIKSLFSIAILCFNYGSRGAYHSHAFNSISWLLSGSLCEDRIVSRVDGDSHRIEIWEGPSIKPIITTRDNLHKVHGMANKSRVLTFRGPWDKTWKEYFQDTKRFVTLSNGRRVVE